MIKLVIALVLAGGGFAGYRYYQQSRVPTETITRSTASATKKAGPKVDLQAFLDKGNLRAEPIRCEGGKCQLTLALKKQPVCFEGDWESINMDLKFSNKKTILVSIEPLSKDATTFRPLAWRLPLKTFLEEGLQQKLEFPPVSLPTPLGLFICKDSENTGRCLDKPQMDSSTAEMKLAEALQADPTAQAVDKVYFFQWIVLEKNRVLVNKPGESFWTPSMYDGRASYLVALTPERLPDANTVGSEFEIKQEMLFALQRHNTLKSVALDVREGVISAVLPAQDKTLKCVPDAKN